MIRIVAAVSIAAAMITFALAAVSYNSPMVPGGADPMIPILNGPMAPNGGPMAPNVAGGSSPPPGSCTGTIDLSTGCAQLIAFGGLF